MTDAIRTAPVQPLNEADVQRVFLALSRPRRLAIFLHLAAAGPTGRPLAALGVTLTITGSALTAHLRALEEAGLIVMRLGPRAARAPVVVADMDRCVALALWLADAGREPSGALPAPTRVAFEAILADTVAARSTGRARAIP